MGKRSNVREILDLSSLNDEEKAKIQLNLLKTADGQHQGFAPLGAGQARKGLDGQGGAAGLTAVPRGSHSSAGKRQLPPLLRAGQGRAKATRRLRSLSRACCED